MPERSDDRLAAILASVADHLVVSATADPLTTGVSPPNGSAAEPDATTPRVPSAEGRGRQQDAPPRRAERARRARRVLVAAVIVAVIGVVGTAVAPVREAVAGWLGIGSTEIVRVPPGAGEDVGEGDPSGLPYLGDDLVPVERTAAEQRLRAPLPDTSGTGLGPAEVLALPPEGGVIMAWDDGATTLWVRGDERPAGEIVSKLLTFDDRLERIDGLGEDAAIVEGAHVLGTPQRRLAAGTVLVWIADGFEYRLESDLGRERMLAIAGEVRPG
jgi:hypothetical protein